MSSQTNRGLNKTEKEHTYHRYQDEAHATGNFTTLIEGQSVKGIVYLDASGTLKEDKSENPTSVSLTGKIGGGFGLDFAFSGNLRTTEV